MIPLIRSAFQPELSPMKLTSLGVFIVSFAVLFVAEVVSGQLPLTLTPFDVSGIYNLREKAGWTVSLTDKENVATANYRYVLKRNGLVELDSGSIDLKSGTARIETALAEPGMLYLEISSSASTEDRARVGAAVAPTSLQPSVPCPADFDEFWASKIKMLQAIEPDPVLVPGDSEMAGIKHQTIKLKNIDGSHVYGQIAQPAREGKFPAMLILQWAGGPYPLEKSWVTDRAAEGWLALNIEPHDVPGDLPPAFYAALPTMIKRYNTIGNDNRDKNYFLRMYLGAYRAAEYLANHPNWNGRTLLVTGTSMGGQQSLAVAGLHPRITHLIVHVPAGADSNASLHGRAAGYPNWDLSDSKVRDTALYFDTVYFAARIKIPSLVSMGFLDTVCPPAGIWTAFNQIVGPKEAVPLVTAAHNHESTAEQQQAYTDRFDAWLAALVKDEEPTIKPLVTSSGAN
jgi:cephalosporin-C deacetylase